MNVKGVAFWSDMKREKVRLCTKPNIYVHTNETVSSISYTYASKLQNKKNLLNFHVLTPPPPPIPDLLNGDM